MIAEISIVWTTKIKMEYSFIFVFTKEHNGEFDFLKRIFFYLEKVHYSKLCTGNTSYKYCWKQFEVSCRFFSNLNSNQWIFLKNIFGEVSLCLVVVISIWYSSLEVTFWTVSTLKFSLKSCSVIVYVLTSLFCLMRFSQVDVTALIRCIH